MMEILLTLVLFAPVVWLMERTHRRTRDLPRMPLGADAESAASSTYRRQLAELRQLTQLDRAETGQPAMTSPEADVRPRPRPSTADRLRRTMGSGFSPLGGWSGTATTMKSC